MLKPTFFKTWELLSVQFYFFLAGGGGRYVSTSAATFMPGVERSKDTDCEYGQDGSASRKR